MESSILFERIEALRRQQRIVWEAVAWIFVWLVASPLVMASIKTLTSSPSLAFPYPWLLVGFSNFGSWVLCFVLQFIPGLVKDTNRNVPVPWKEAGVLGLMQGFEVGLGADILHRISITMRTEIHMLCPALMFVCGVVSGLERLEPRLVFSVSVVTLGGMLASYGTMTWDGLALVPLALLASVISTFRWVLTQKWLSPAGEIKPSPLALALRMSPMTALVGFMVALVREPGCYQTLIFSPDPFKVSCLLFTISLGVCLMLVAEMRVVQLTSALLLAFMYPFHNVSVILLDATMKGTRLSGLNWVGVAMCALASGFYSHARKQDKERLIGDFRQAPPYHSTEATQSATQPQLAFAEA